jgi:hypothetical protein
VSPENPFLELSDIFLQTRDSRKLIRCVSLDPRVLIRKEIEVISSECFSGCRFVNEVIFEPKSELQVIGERAFTLTALQKIMIPATVGSIGGQCFCGCGALCVVDFEQGSKLEIVGDMAFYETGVKKIVVPKSVKVIGAACFSRCMVLSEVVFEGSVGQVGVRAFENCPLRAIKVFRGMEVSDSLRKMHRIQFI